MFNIGDNVCLRFCAIHGRVNSTSRQDKEILVEWENGESSGWIKEDSVSIVPADGDCETHRKKK